MDEESFVPITEAEYRRVSRDNWMHQKVRTIVPLDNGNLRIPAGAVLVIEDKQGGFQLIGPPCSHCGVAIRITKVRPGKLARLLDQQDLVVLES